MKLEDRVNEAFDDAIRFRAAMQSAWRAMQQHEETAKMENLEEWVAAKNNDIRKAIVLRALEENHEYQTWRSQYADARDDLKLALLDIERVKLLVRAAEARPQP